MKVRKRKFAVDVERVTWERYFVVAESPEAAAALVEETPSFERADRFEAGPDWDLADGQIQVYAVMSDGRTIGRILLPEDGATAQREALG